MIFQGITIDQLLNSIDGIVESRIKELLHDFNNEKKASWITRKQVATLLHVSLPTVHDWTKKGLLKSFRINRRILYKSDDVEAALTKRKFK